MQGASGASPVNYTCALQLFVGEHAGTGAENDAGAYFGVIANAHLPANDRAFTDDT